MFFLFLPLNCFQILDFGLARHTDDEMTGYVATRWYRAPEIMLNWMHYNMTGGWCSHTHPWPFHPSIRTIVVNLCPASLFSGYLVSGVYNGWTPHRKNSVSWYRPYPSQWYNRCARWASDTICIIKSCRLNARWQKLGKDWLICFSTINWSAPEFCKRVESQRGNIIISAYWIRAKSITSTPLLKNKSLGCVDWLMTKANYSWMFEMCWSK